MESEARTAQTKPQLMAIVRMHGDEAVLTNCKTSDPGVGPTSADPSR